MSAHMPPESSCLRRRRYPPPLLPPRTPPVLQQVPQSLHRTFLSPRRAPPAPRRVPLHQRQIPLSQRRVPPAPPAPRQIPPHQWQVPLSQRRVSPAPPRIPLAPRRTSPVRRQFLPPPGHRRFLPGLPPRLRRSADTPPVPSVFLQAHPSEPDTAPKLSGAPLRSAPHTVSAVPESPACAACRF